MALDDPSEPIFFESEEDVQESVRRPPARRHRRISVLRSLGRHKLLAFWMMILMSAVSMPVLYWRSGRPLYRTESLVLISPVLQKNVIEDQQFEVPRYEEVVTEQLALVIREDVTVEALQRLGEKKSLWERPAEGIREAAARLSGELIVKRVPESTYISVGLEAGQPEGLAEIVNAVVDSYLAKAGGQSFQGRRAREELLDRHRGKLSEEIRKKSDQLAGLSKELGLAVAEKSSDMPTQGVSNAPELTSLAGVRARRIQADAKLASLGVQHEALKGQDLTIRARSLTAADPELNALRAALLPRRNDLRGKLLGMTPDHEGRKSIEITIAEIDTELARAEKSTCERLVAELAQQRDFRMADEVLAAKAELEQARRMEEKLLADQAAQSSKLDQYTQNYFTAVHLRQELDRLQKQLAAVEDRIDAIRLEEQAPGLVMRVTEAQTPSRPVRRPLSTMIGLLVAAALGLALLVPVIVDVADHRVMSPVDVEFAADARPLGWIMDRNPRTESFAADQMRRLALSLERQRRLHHRSRIAFTSLRPDGGNTQLTLDVAYQLRSIGLRVLVIEANALTPDPRFRAPQGFPGLAAALGGRAPIARTILPAVDGLPDRVVVGDTGGRMFLPGCQQLRPMLEELSKTYDLILLDAPPILFSADAELIAGIVDGVILVVEAEKVVTGEVRRAMDILRQIGPGMVETVVNRVRDYRGHGYYSDLVNQYEAAGRSRTS